MPIETSKLISQANKCYYADDEPILTDAEFDLLSESGLNVVLDNIDTSQKVRHSQVTRSLSKQKTPLALELWLKDFQGTLYVCPKYDGNSIRLTYHNGRLFTAATRGDGKYGINITSAIRRTACVAQLQTSANVEISFEAILPKNAQVNGKDTNLRNIVAGALHAKEFQSELLTQIHLIAYQVESAAYTNWQASKDQLEQFPEVEQTVYVQLQKTSGLTPEALFQQLNDYYDQWKEELPYAIDGVVLHACFPDGHLRNDVSLSIPKNSTAVKFAETIYPAEIDQICWTQGLHRRLTPVVLFTEPVFIDGTHVQRSSASNYALAAAAGLGPGAQVGIVKAGDIIPEIKEVYSKAAVSLELPACPDCGQLSQLDSNGVQALCVNPSCVGAVSVKLKKQIQLLQIPNFSDATVQRLFDAGHTTLAAILRLTRADFLVIDGLGAKRAAEFEKALQQLQILPETVLVLCRIPGLAEKRAQQILAYYNTLTTFISELQQTSGILEIPKMHEISTALFIAKDEIFEMFQLMQSYISSASEVPSKFKYRVCVTDAHPTMKRSILKQAMSRVHIGLEGVVSSKCKYLVCANLFPEKPSSKYKRAQKLGVEIISYEQFDKLLQ